MKLPNSYGSVTKLPGKRRKPYMARMPEDKQTGQRKILGYYHSKAEALTALAEYHDNPLMFKSDMTVEDVWSLTKDVVKVSDERREVYCRNFDNYFSPIKDMLIKDVRTAHLQSILDNCEHGYSTKSNIRTVMKHIFSYAMMNDLIKTDYVKYITFEQEATMIQRVVFTQEEISKLWSHADLEEYASTIVLLHQGMRIKELRDMKKDWIDLDKKTIDIKIAKNKYSIRTVPINNTIYSIIKEYYDKSEDEYVFHLKKTQLDYFIKKVLGHTPYDVRHTFASRCNELDIKTVVIQRLMGHKPETLVEQVYIHLTLEELSEAINMVTY